ncbi:dTMP kinase [candidate division WOR-3 bacterium]|nr:dTMP kinase [candidate division WOR-3 bacterium]
MTTYKQDKKKHGIFITFEGVEGSGKSVQCELLYKYLLSKKYNVLITKEPGGTMVGEKIRDILLDSDEDIDVYTELFLYLADRAEHLAKIINTNLEKDNIVISDRHFDSTIAYQMAGRGIKEEELNLLKNLKLFSKREPDVTFLLDVDPEEVRNRIKNPDRIERENIDFHRRVRKAYLDLARKNMDRFVVIDSRKTIEEIHEKIKKEISVLLDRGVV